ncbi:MAG: universal stress protein [Candidatus Thiodiazotropha sp.]|jgi:universal stress protein A
MSDYKHLLAAIDFSDETDQVLTRALVMAGNGAAKLSLIHVIEYSPYLFPADTPLAVDINLEEQFYDKAKERLDSLANSKGISESPRFVEVGSPTYEIVRVAEEHEVDLIVIGSHGRYGLQRILGSTASGVLHTATCDVLAVRIRER